MWSKVGILLTVLTVHVGGVHVEVALDSDTPWQFIAKFTYMKTSDGFNNTLFRYVIERGDDDVELRLYNDLHGVWKHAREVLDDTSLPTAERCENATSRTVRSGRNGSTVVPAMRRPRVWYVYAFNTNCSTALGVGGGRVVVDMKNPGSWFEREFSADRQLILEGLIGTIVIYIILLVAYGIGTASVARGDEVECAFHPIMRFYVITVCIQVLASSATMISYIKLAQTGQGDDILLLCGAVLDSVAGLLFLLLILVFAMGFKVVQVDQLKQFESVQKRRKSLAIFFVLLVVAHALLVVAQTKMNGWSTAYPYTTVPGIVLASLRLPILIYYLMTLHETLYLMEAMRTFYLTWGTIFAAHITALPVLLMIAMLVDAWVRYKVVFLTDIAVRCLLIVLMGSLLWPGANSQQLLVSGYQRIPQGVTDLSADPGKDKGTQDNEDDKMEEDGL